MRHAARLLQAAGKYLARAKYHLCVSATAADVEKAPKRAIHVRLSCTTYNTINLKLPFVA